ncbi:hypothetical protein E2C01_093514 [Portunus trituberculatus]|uniref:Uncharacterized protein n=1 Tax=Portunus trituberculatus TaxID=210409 RepID=A0A5B7JJ64_PORTR|nr:hypothetical protein [Portunus trituberculatus]
MFDEMVQEIIAHGISRKTITTPRAAVGQQTNTPKAKSSSIDAINRNYFSSLSLCTCFAKIMSKAADEEEDVEDVNTKMVS